MLFTTRVIINCKVCQEKRTFDLNQTSLCSLLLDNHANAQHVLHLACYWAKAIC